MSLLWDARLKWVREVDDNIKLLYEVYYFDNITFRMLKSLKYQDVLAKEMSST